MRKRDKKLREKRANPLVYLVFGGIVALYAKVFKKQRVKTSLPRDLKAPFIIVGNHSNFFDFVYVVRAFYPHRVNFVVARKYFHYPVLSWLMKLAHSIPKSLFQADIGTIAAMMDILKQGGIIGVYPEGQIAIQGITNSNGEAIAKLVKKTEVPVVRVLTGGAYFCDPPWARSSRKGYIESRIDIAVTAEQAKSLSIDEISDIINHSIYIDNFDFQRINDCKYRGNRLAEGLENILYLCPCCKSEFSIVTKDSEIICEICGEKAYFGIDGHLLWEKKRYFSHIGEWHYWQLEHEKTIIEENQNFTVSEPVELAMLKEKGNGIEAVGKGIFTAKRNTYIYNGTLKGEKVTLSFSTFSICCLPFDSGKNFQIYSKNQLYEFRPENPKWCMKISNICEGLNGCIKSEAV
ncbi:MAG: lysophospholipid acyltransferase family protein [Bacillota bacterium]